MIGIFRGIFIDRYSFWLGFLAGALFWWLLSKLREYFPAILRFLRKQIQAARESVTADVETRFCNDTIRLTQKLHIASPLFMLDEITIEPRVLAPPPLITFEKEQVPLDMVNLTIPYLPDWPELAATYRAPTLTLLEALEGGANLILMGHPGSGKTVALSLLGSRIARRDSSIGELAHYVPFFIHASDIPLQKVVASQDPQPEGTSTISIQSPVEVLVETLSKNLSTFTLPKLPAFIHATLDANRAIILLDGLDELPPDRVLQVVNFIDSFLHQYPHTRMVVATSLEQLDRLPALGFRSVAMASWGEDQRKGFIETWSQVWTRFIASNEVTGSSPIEPKFLCNWLLASEDLYSPLELTLKTWAAFAGDMIGTQVPDLIEAYLRRMTIDTLDLRPVMERLAFQMLATMTPQISIDETSVWDSELEPPNTPSLIESEMSEGYIPTINSPGKQAKLNQSSISSLINNGVLTAYPDTRIGFTHLEIMSYLAGLAWAKTGSQPGIQDHPFWTGKSLAITFLACFSDISTLVQKLLNQDDYLHREQLRVARWLRLTPHTSSWRPLVLRTLATSLSKEQGTLGLAARLISAIALSGEPGVAVLFRQLIKSEHPNLRQLAALGSGLVRDSKAVDDLFQLCQESHPAIIRAANLGLIAIGDKKGLEAVASTLMHGHELARRYAAEALANNPEEGYPALEEGSTLEDLMVRRAVVFGLARIEQPWALQRLDKMQMEDKEWFVRNAAIQVLEELKHKSAYIPHPLPALTETSWLIEYAGRLGMGVAPGQPALDLIYQAAKTGSEDERLAALEYYALSGDVKSIALVYNLFFSGPGDVHEAAYQTLWDLSATGIDLPSPHQFGLG